MYRSCRLRNIPFFFLFYFLLFYFSLIITEKLIDWTVPGTICCLIFPSRQCSVHSQKILSMERKCTANRKKDSKMTVQCCAMREGCAMLCNAVQCCAMREGCAMLCNERRLCNAVQCCAMLCNAVQWEKAVLFNKIAGIRPLVAAQNVMCLFLAGVQ